MKVLIGAPVHQKREIFKEYLESLDFLESPHDCKVDRYFIFHNNRNLIDLVDSNKYYYSFLDTEDAYKKDERTHYWNQLSVDRVIVMKNEIIRFAKERDYDYIFFVDSDLILHPKTLITLIESQKDIVAEIFWTKWLPTSKEEPNAWDYDSYGFKTEHRADLWRAPGLYRIGMSGACILIRRQVLQAGVNYSRLYNISFWGEDRHFCIRAAAHDFEIWLDTHYPCTHLYRDSDYENFIQQKHSAKSEVF